MLVSSIMIAHARTDRWPELLTFVLPSKQMSLVGTSRPAGCFVAM
jgi:hypothetical protein